MRYLDPMRNPFDWAPQHNKKNFRLIDNTFVSLIQRLACQCFLFMPPAIDRAFVVQSPMLSTDFDGTES